MTSWISNSLHPISEVLSLTSKISFLTCWYLSSRWTYLLTYRLYLFLLFGLAWSFSSSLVVPTYSSSHFCLQTINQKDRDYTCGLVLQFEARRSTMAYRKILKSSRLLSVRLVNLLRLMRWFWIQFQRATRIWLGARLVEALPDPISLSVAILTLSFHYESERFLSYFEGKTYFDTLRTHPDCS